MNLCACDSEEREHVVGAGVNATMPSETLYCNPNNYWRGEINNSGLHRHSK
jgi:hypothetical protein